MTLVTSSVVGQTCHYAFAPVAYPVKILDYKIENIAGYCHWISNLNNSGTFTPGVFRANPVVIGRCFARNGKQSDRIDIVSTTKSPWGYYRLILEHGAMWGARYATSLGLLSQSSWDTAMTQSLMRGSLQSAYSELTTPEFDLGTNLGELKETILGLTNLLSAFRTYIKQYNRLRKLTVREWQRNKNAILHKRNNYYRLNALGGSWLEWRMGIYPLIKTLEDLWEHLNSPIVDCDDRLRRVRAALKSSTETTSKVEFRPGATFFVRGRNTRTEKFKAATSVYFTQPDPFSFTERYGLDLMSAPGIAWELTRLSFVVDRFIRIGDYLGYLKALTAGKVNVVGTSTSLKYTREDNFKLDEVYWPYAKFPSIPRNEYGTTYHILDRRINLTLPLVPTVNWRNLSVQQWLDHAALIWQAIPQPNWKREMQNAHRLDLEFRRASIPSRLRRNFR